MFDIVTLQNQGLLGSKFLKHFGSVVSGDRDIEDGATCRLQVGWVD